MRRRARAWGAGLLAAVLTSGGCTLAAAPPAAAGARSAAAGAPPVISTVVGGAGRGVARATSMDPSAVAAGPDGTLYEGDRNGAVRVLHSDSDQAGTLAGAGPAQSAPFVPHPPVDGGPAGRAPLGAVGGTAVDQDGNVPIADAGNSRIWVVAARTGVAYGQAMTAGHIYTIAGDGIFGFCGDRGPAINASLSSPQGVAVDWETTLAGVGAGATGFAGDDGPAARARLGS